MYIDYKFDWKTYSWIKRGPRRISILKYLAKATEPLTATQVKKMQKISIHITHTKQNNT